MNIAVIGMAMTVEVRLMYAKNVRVGMKNMVSSNVELTGGLTAESKADV